MMRGSGTGQATLAAEKLNVPVNRSVARSATWNDGSVEGTESLARALAGCRAAAGVCYETNRTERLLLRPLVTQLYLDEITAERAAELFRVQHPRVLASCWR